MASRPEPRPLFVFVHGGQQGAWVFDRVIEELKRRDYPALAVDLPAHDPDAGASEYADVIASSLDEVADGATDGLTGGLADGATGGLADGATGGLAGGVVLVGHSMGGLTIPLVAQRRPIRRLVFLCAAYPEPGRSHMEVKAEEAGERVSASAMAAWRQPGEFHQLARELARELFFHDCPPETQEWALARLRPQARKPLREKTPLTRWPDVPRTLILTTEDRCIPLESARRTAARLFGERPIELPGGHCPMLSRPALLAQTLIDALSAHAAVATPPHRSTLPSGKDGEHDEHLQ